MEKEKKTKNGNTIKILTIVLAMILISMIGFIGIYTRKQNRMENIIEGYGLAMDLKGSRVVSIAPVEDKETVIKDAEGNKIEEDLTDDEKRLLTALQEKDWHVDDLIERCQIPAPRALAALTLLEVKGYVKRLPGKRFSLSLNQQ